MKVAFLGDSLTFGFGLHMKEKWPYIIGQEKGWEIINAGISGDTSGGNLSRLKEVLDQKPDVLFIMTGGNDFVAGCGTETVKANVISICQQSAAQGIRIYVASETKSIPSEVSESWKAIADFDEFNKKQEEMSIWYERYCRAFSFNYVNVFKEYSEATGDGTEFYQDGIHPNEKGARILADIIGNHIKV